MTARRKAVTGRQARDWRIGLGLSTVQAGDALNLSNPSVTFREYERAGTPGGKSPSPPTVALMDLTASAALAVFFLQRGETAAALHTLIRALPIPIVAGVSLRNEKPAGHGVPAGSST